MDFSKKWHWKSLELKQLTNVLRSHKKDLQGQKCTHKERQETLKIKICIGIRLLLSMALSFKLLVVLIILKLGKWGEISNYLCSKKYVLAPSSP